MPEIHDSLRLKIQNFADQIKEIYHIDHVYLYGSYATGTQDEWSDLDIAVVLDEPESHSKEIFHLGKEYDSDFEAFGFTKEDFDHSRLPIIPEIKQKGILII